MWPLCRCGCCWSSTSSSRPCSKRCPSPEWPRWVSSTRSVHPHPRSLLSLERPNADPTSSGRLTHSPTHTLSLSIYTCPSPPNPDAATKAGRQGHGAPGAAEPGAVHAAPQEERGPAVRAGWDRANHIPSPCSLPLSTHLVPERLTQTRARALLWTPIYPPHACGTAGCSTRWAARRG